jgi:hypothetical protein
LVGKSTTQSIYHAQNDLVKDKHINKNMNKNMNRKCQN